VNIGFGVILAGLAAFGLIGMIVTSQAGASAGVAAGSAGGASGQAGAGGPVPSVAPGSHGLVTTAALAQIAAQHHWNAAEVADWMRVIVSESNGTLTDKNPGSGAYGIAQFINGPGEYYTYGGNPNTLTGQLTAMANYIAQRYGNPSAAWAFHQAHNWY